jgi:G3E family GTPase
MNKLLPVTLLSGFLGSGKTTLLNHLLAHAGGRRIGVIVNDLSAVNVDAGLIVRTDQELVELSNGCICCTLRDELVAQVVRLARSGGLDYLVIESTGVSEPLPVAQGFVLEAEGVNLRDVARLDTLVTVVDGPSFLNDFATLDKVEDRNPDAPAEDRRNIVDLLVDQVEFADVLVVNKTDLVGSRDLQAIRSRLQALNPSARIVEAEFGRVDPALVLDSKSFDYDRSMALPAWERELSKPHIPETVEYGIANFSVVADRPFHPERLYRYFSRPRPELLRAKGWFTLATQPGARWVFHLAGAKKKIEFGGWDGEGVGPSKEVEMVFIGLWGTKGPKLKKELEKCLVKPGERVDPRRDPFAGYLGRATTRAPS